MANYLPFFKICLARKRKPKAMLKSVGVPLQDINKCIKDYQGLLNGAPKNVTIGNNICAGFVGQDSCQVRFRMQN